LHVTSAGLYSCSQAYCQLCLPHICCHLPQASLLCVAGVTTCYVSAHCRTRFRKYQGVAMSGFAILYVLRIPSEGHAQHTFTNQRSKSAGPGSATGLWHT
jgi:hypothetical protein